MPLCRALDDKGWRRLPSDTVNLCSSYVVAAFVHRIHGSVNMLAVKNHAKAITLQDYTV